MLINPENDTLVQNGNDTLVRSNYNIPGTSDIVSTLIQKLVSGCFQLYTAMASVQPENALPCRSDINIIIKQ